MELMLLTPILWRLLHTWVFGRSFKARQNGPLHLFGSLFQNCFAQFYRASLSTGNKHLGLNDSSFLANSALASFCGVFLVSHEFNIIVLGTEGKIFHVHVVVLLTAPQNKVLGEQEPHGLYRWLWRMACKHSFGPQQLTVLRGECLCSVWPFSETFLTKKPSSTFLLLENSISMAIEKAASFSLRGRSNDANITLKLSGSYSEPSFLRISAKNFCYVSSSQLFHFNDKKAN